ncbi:MAG TPA: C25 family cysteine peptidase [Candidatus Sulfotelmatobacter sp.]|nr:C25 family cysteine peptidase [Candidatus Sulfotelmatobacter sp.]
MIEGGADSKVFADSKLFQEIVRPLLEQGLNVRFQARGASMSPAVRDGEVVEVTPVMVTKLRKDDIVLAKSNAGFRLHRIVAVDPGKDVFITRGDCGQQNDPALKAEQILGLARAKEVRVGRNIVQAKFRGMGGWLLRSAARAQYLSRKLLRARAITSLYFAIAIAALLLGLATDLSAQVAVDSATSGAAVLTGAGTATLTIAHTTAGTNRLMLVGVSMNITNAATTGVVGVSWNGTPLSFVGAHDDATNTRRVEMWSLLAPATGTFNVVVSVNIPAAVNIGVVAGVTTFTGVDQTVPLGTFVSANGAAGTSSQLDVPSVINGMILDTLAIEGDRGATVPGPQVSRWNVATPGGTANPDVRSVGTSRTGAPAVPISITFTGGASNWSYGAVSVNPSTADISVSTSVSAVALGQNSTYNITITNNGPSAANSVTLADTYANANLSLVSVTTSAGTTCPTTAPTISCNLPDPFPSGATATVTVTVSTTAAGFYPNTATITDSGAPADPNTGNNTYVALAPVVSVVCSTTTLTAGGNLTGQINTYWPGNGNVAIGATSIPVGAANGTGTIANGSLLLIVQMQDASINTSNSGAYGNGSTGSGFTTINNAGNYEYVKATGPIAGGSVPITGAGAGSGTVFAYTTAAATTTKGASTFQVVLVPQYTSATLTSGITTPSWNGSTGGILALDIAGQLNLGAASVNVDGDGFRGGAGMQLTGGVAGAVNTDYRQVSPATYTGAAGGATGIDAAKGEGVAGTPMWVESGGTFLQTTTGIGYPNGTTAADASMAHGAPGNAGGGGTDGDAAGNTENSGGGGGGNGGTGGFGGNSWNANLSDGGQGGSPFPAAIDRLAMGGGGGAGTRNNSDGDNQASAGSSGGGIIFIRADSLSGTATLTANGVNAYTATKNDAGGGGGAGGTIVVLSANGGESGLTLQANGGRGGDAWDSQPYSLADRHGPGGGGAGGAIFVSGTPASMSVAGGGNGTTLTPGVAYGATPGSAGTTNTSATLGQVTGIQSSALCTPDLTLTKSHVGNFTRGAAASYTITVSNVSPYGSTTGLVTVNDTLPFGISPTGGTGTNWSCSVSGQTLSCTTSAVESAGASYPSITLNALVSQSAPATLTNIANTSGGGEANLLNDTAIDVANVGSTADLSMSDAASPNPVAAGSNITYTQIVTNNGPSAADNATMVTSIPSNMTFVSLIVPTGWTCATPTVGSFGSIVCTSVQMPGLTAATFTLVAKVNSGVANGTLITNTATASSSTLDPNSLNNSASVSTVVGTTAGGELTVTNSASPNPVQATNNITYTQLVTNTGTAAATTATFTENTPANTTFVSITPPAGWTCSGFPPTCTNPSVGAGTSGTFRVVYTVNSGTASGTVITDTAIVNAANQAFGANSATATDIVATGTQADLALTTTATPSAVFAGNNITYTQTITNNGPAASSAVVFTEATPTNTTFQSISPPAGWTCTTPAVGSSGTITCNDSSLASTDSANLVIVLNVPSTVAASTITANSSVTATTTDPTSANNSTTVVTDVGVSCDLAVTNSGTNAVQVGNNITYTQIITNNGPSSCSTGTLNEATPANTTFVSVGVVNSGGATWSCPNTAPVACTAATVPPGSSATVTAIYKATGGTSITDTVNVATTSHDSSLSNNSATFVTDIATGAQADLVFTQSASPNPVNAGSIITYTQVVTNGGPNTAAAPVVSETLPANTTFGTLNAPGWNCTITVPYRCTDTTTMGPGATATITFTVTVNSTVAAGSTITDTASVSSTTSDPNSANNSATVTTQVATSSDLSITNTATPFPVQAGNNISFTQLVTNNGPSTATTVTVPETLPTGTTFSSLTGTGGFVCTSTVPYSCTAPSLAPAAAGTITFVVTVPAGTADGTTFTDTASVSSAISDPNSSNNSATATDVVAASTDATLVLTNTPSATSVTAGSNVTFTQKITNDGPANTANGPTFTETIPPNMTFQSITPPANWTCSTPPLNGTGTINCTLTGRHINANSSQTFSVVLQVVSGTPSGTSITDTATSSASNMPPGLTTNTASTTIVVANANSADMAIVKTATPNPVTEGTPLTYSLAVTNNGPASATNVTVTDTLPSSVTYLSSTSTVGTCSEAGGIVTCLLGTMANAGTATITILTIPEQPGLISNTATVTADQTDPNLANNTSTQNEIVVAPTRITLRSFSARYGTDRNGANRVMLIWKTGGESHNLGFNVYREVNGNRVRMNPSIIAGSALMMSGALSRHAAKSYAWIDPSAPGTGTSYWLEDIDVNGTRTMHGPVFTAGTQSSAEAAPSESRMLSQMNQAQPPAPGSQETHVSEAFAATDSPAPWQFEKQFELASHPAIKLNVRHERWYRVGQPELVKAGLDPNVDPATLHLYAEAVEQPIQITGATAGPGGFSPQAAISFYGTGINTVFSGTRVYWLVGGEGRGARIPHIAGSSGSNQPPANYSATVELQQHAIYFSALLTSNGDNFFGGLVSSTPLEQILVTPHLDASATQAAQLELSLQGIILGFPHDVAVSLNGTNLGDVTFIGQDKGKLTFDVPPGVLRPWGNTITLTAQNGDYDTSLVDYIRITYPRRYVADSDQLKFTGRAGDEITVSNFSTPPVVLDITDPNRPMQLTPQVTSQDGKYQIAVQVPFTTTNSQSTLRHTLLAVADDRVSSPAGIMANHPSHWYSPQSGADIAMVTYGEFAGALAPLVRAHTAEGKTSAVIPVGNLYDEFNFGEHSPLAIKRFLQAALKNWKRPPAYLLLNGRASVDPRNYLGFGNLDLVPTRIVPSSSLMTASDDWFSDFKGNGTPTIATGRLPVSTIEEAKVVAEKISTYEGQSTNGSWTSNALFVADKDDIESFTQDTQTVQAGMPSTMQMTNIFVDNVGVSSARGQIANSINSGQALVNYLGHGSEEQWAGPDIFDENTVNSLTNGSQLPVFLIMDCLNGLFQDVYAQPLGVSLILAPNGGGVAVLASSGLNQPTPQTDLDAMVVQSMFTAKGMALGDAIVTAKSNIADPDVRRTFVLFGDPAMKVKPSNPTVH